MNHHLHYKVRTWIHRRVDLFCRSHIKMAWVCKVYLDWLCLCGRILCIDAWILFAGVLGVNYRSLVSLKKKNRSLVWWTGVHSSRNYKLLIPVIQVCELQAGNRIMIFLTGRNCKNRFFSFLFFEKQQQVSRVEWGMKACSYSLKNGKEELQTEAKRECKPLQKKAVWVNKR